MNAASASPLVVVGVKALHDLVILSEAKDLMAIATGVLVEMP
jgi:hypothetical protein